MRRRRKQRRISAFILQPVFSLRSHIRLLHTHGPDSVAVLNSKSHGVLIVKVRGTRFALGRNITKNILVG